MTRTFRTISSGMLLVCGALCGLQAAASPELDARYGFRSVSVAVLNPDANPLFASQVQKALETEVAAISRFELRKDLEGLAPAFSEITTLDGTASTAWAKPLAIVENAGVQAVLVSNLSSDPETKAASLQLALVAVDGTTIARSENSVDDAKSIPSFVGTARRMVREMAKSLPFDATILNRDGYRLVLDHGLPELYAGLKLAAFTIEQQNGRLALVETGKLEIQRAESRLAFAQVLVEKRPRQITSGNKVRFEPLRESESFVPLLPSPGRGLSSLMAADGSGTVEPDDEELHTQNVAAWSRLTHGRYGNAQVDLTGSYLTWNRAGATSEVGSDSSFYPGVAIGGEVWITRNWLVEGSFELALSGLNAPAASGAGNLNSQISQMRLNAGYRFRLVNMDLTPLLTVRLGYARTQYKVDTSTSSLAPVAGAYSGIQLGADLTVPLSDKFGMGLTTALLALPSYSQNIPVQTASISGWEFGINSYYYFSQVLLLEAGLSFQANSVDFVPGSSGTNSALSASQNLRRFAMGARYYF